MGQAIASREAMPQSVGTSNCNYTTIAIVQRILTEFIYFWEDDLIAICLTFQYRSFGTTVSPSQRSLTGVFLQKSDQSFNQSRTSGISLLFL